MSMRLTKILGIAVVAMAAYLAGSPRTVASQAKPITEGTVPKSYGRMVTAIADSIGTGLVFEDDQGVIRFVSITGMKEGELARYDQTPTHGGIPRSYGHLVSAVVRNGNTALVFQDAQGVIRFVTITGVLEGELTRN